MGPPLKTSRSEMRWTSIRSRQNLFQLRHELLPARLGASEGLLLIGPEACLLHAQVRPRARPGEGEGHHALQVVGRVVVREIPGVGQCSVRLDGEHFAVQHAAPVATKVEAMAQGW